MRVLRWSECTQLGPKATFGAQKGCGSRESKVFRAGDRLKELSTWAETLSV